MVASLQLFLAVGVALVPFAAGQVDKQLTGTWTTKSRKVVTGPVSDPHTTSIVFQSTRGPAVYGSVGASDTMELMYVSRVSMIP